jgi:flagellar protein FlgJ
MSTGPVGPGPGDLLGALRSGRIQGDDARLRTATKLLEGTFYQELFKVMRETVPEGGAVSGGFGEDVFSGMMDQHVADSAAADATGGLADALYRYFTGTDATQSDSASAADEPTGEGRG